MRAASAAFGIAVATEEASGEPPGSPLCVLAYGWKTKRGVCRRSKNVAKVKEMTSKASEPAKVDAYMGELKHPLAKLVADLRQIILSTDKEIGEEIKWNAPTFFYSGLMKPTPGHTFTS